MNLPTPIPRHVAVIMDGNGRWARHRGLPRSAGHEAGADTVRTIVRTCREIGVQVLTLYSFSTENWSRPEQEVSDLMGLLKRFIRNDLAELHSNGVRVRVIGSRENVPPDIIGLIDDAEATTRNNTNMTMVVAFN